MQSERRINNQILGHFSIAVSVTQILTLRSYMILRESKASICERKNNENFRTNNAITFNGVVRHYTGQCNPRIVIGLEVLRLIHSRTDESICQCVCTLITHGGRQNVVGTSVTLLAWGTWCTPLFILVIGNST